MKRYLLINKFSRRMLRDLDSTVAIIEPVHMDEVVQIAKEKRLEIRFSDSKLHEEIENLLLFYLPVSRQGFFRFEPGDEILQVEVVCAPDKSRSYFFSKIRFLDKDSKDMRILRTLSG